MKGMAMMIGAVVRSADGCVIIQSPYCNAPVVPHVIVIKKHTSGHPDNHKAHLNQAQNENPGKLDLFYFHQAHPGSIPKKFRYIVKCGDMILILLPRYNYLDNQDT